MAAVGKPPRRAKAATLDKLQHQLGDVSNFKEARDLTASCWTHGFGMMAQITHRSHSNWQIPSSSQIGNGPQKLLDQYGY